VSTKWTRKRIPKSVFIALLSLPLLLSACNRNDSGSGPVTTGRELMREAERRVGLISNPNYNRVLQEARILVSSSSKPDQLLGYRAVSGSLPHLYESTVVDAGLLHELEDKAIKANSPESVSALVSLLRLDADSRDSSLTSQVDGRSSLRAASDRTLSFYAAGLALVSTQAPNAPKPGRFFRQPYELALSLIGSTLSQQPRPQDIAGTAQLLKAKADPDHFLAALLLLSDNNYRKSFLNAGTAEFLAECASSSSTSAIDKNMSDACFNSYFDDFRNEDSPVNASHLLMEGVVYAADKPLGDREYELSVDPSSIIVYHGWTLTPPAGSRIRDARHAAVLKNFGINPDALCFDGGTLNSHWTPNAGSVCYQRFSDSLKSADLSNMAVTEFGFQHYTYVSPGGTASIGFKVRVGFKPSPETNWVLARFHPDRGQPSEIGVVCTSGCQATSPAVIEPSSRWAVFSVVPHALLEFQSSFTATTDLDGNHTLGQLIRKDGIEIADLNEANAAQVTSVFPLELVKLSDSNPLISYIAGLQAALRPSDWLLPQSQDVVRSCQLGRSRLTLLKELAKMPRSDVERVLLPELVNAGSETYRMALWHERQAFLLNVLPVLSGRQSSAYEQPLELQIALTNSYLPDVNAARNQLSDALDSLDKLSQQRASEILSKVPGSVGLGQSVGPKLETLAAEIVGASEAVSRVQHGMLITQKLGCDILRSFDNDQSALSQPTISKTAQLCQDAK
jgi:hypothetical protein